MLFCRNLLLHCAALFVLFTTALFVVGAFFLSVHDDSDGMPDLPVVVTNICEGTDAVPGNTRQCADMWFGRSFSQNSLVADDELRSPDHPQVGGANRIDASMKGSLSPLRC